MAKSSMNGNTGNSSSKRAKSTRTVRVTGGGQDGEPKTNESEENSLRQLFEKELKLIYNAEKQLINAIPEMAKAAYDEELEDAFQAHLVQTEKQAERLEKVFSRLRIDKEEEQNTTMEDLIECGKKVIEGMEESPVRDAALIIAAQKVEHYEMACYGALCELADILGFHKVADVLDRSLAEEEMTDRQLSDIAHAVNCEAAEMEEEELELY